MIFSSIRIFKNCLLRYNNIAYATIFLFTVVGCEEILNEENLENDAVVLVAPSNQATVSQGSIRFDWEDLEGASSYRIQIAQPNFRDIEQIIYDETVQDSIGQFIELDLNVGNYEWRVRAQNGAYESPYTSRALQVN